MSDKNILFSEFIGQLPNIFSNIKCSIKNFSLNNYIALLRSLQFIHVLNLGLYCDLLLEK